MESISAPMQDQLLGTKPYLSNPPKDPAPASVTLSEVLPSASSSILICRIFFCVKKTLHPSQGATPFNCLPFWQNTSRAVMGSESSIFSHDPHLLTEPALTGHQQLRWSKPPRQPFPNTPVSSHPPGWIFPVVCLAPPMSSTCPGPGL